MTVDDLADLVARHFNGGDDGLTISGGEPLAQANGLGELFDAVRQRCAGGAFDIMLFTGYELSELDTEQARTAATADVLITGRFEAAQPTRLIWRGSANQVMHLQSDLGRHRYESFVDYSPASPLIQLRTDADGFWLVGVPWQGTLAAIERALRASGLDLASVSWRRER